MYQRIIFVMRWIIAANINKAGVIIGPHIWAALPIFPISFRPEKNRAIYFHFTIRFFIGFIFGRTSLTYERFIPWIMTSINNIWNFSSLRNFFIWRQIFYWCEIWRRRLSHEQIVNGRRHLPTFYANACGHSQHKIKIILTKFRALIK